MSNRHKWSIAEVSASRIPEANLRSYLERRAVRSFLNTISQDMPIKAAVDIGCGFGRLTMVLSEYADLVTGYEREPKLAKIAQSLLPDVQIEMVKSLAELPCQHSSFDFAMLFTVLGHMSDSDAKATLLELDRIMKPKSYILIVDQTDRLHSWSNMYDMLHFTHGRSVETYAEWMLGWELISIQKRIVEPTYPKTSVGDYMLFLRCQHLSP